jgi:aqualysin 1
MEMKHTGLSKRSVLSALALAIGLTVGLSVSVAQAQSVNLPAQPTRMGKPIADEYIVRLNANVRDVPATARSLAQAHGGTVMNVYENAIKGFSIRMPAAAVTALSNNPNVLSVEQNAQIFINASQNSAPWGLDRIDQVDRPLSSTYEYKGMGQGVRAYVIDTGIRTTHRDFNKRVLAGFTAIKDGRGTSDCNGHGTHVAGTVGGSTWGVAKGVQLVPVRVLDCNGSGTISDVIAGVDWVAAQTHRPAVANMSLGGGTSDSLDAVVAGAINKGVSMVVAAGNDNADACNYSPARAPDAVTVGASTSADARAGFSNFGSCVDVFAPGSSITSAWHTGDTASFTLNGTSMAAPHAAGVVALMLESKPDATPLAIAEHLKKTASVNKLSSIGTGSPNLLLYSMSSMQPQEIAAVNVGVAGLTGRAIVSKANWRAEVRVLVGELSNGAAVANASVSVEFVPGGTVSCTTDSAGSCTVSSPAYKNTVNAVDAVVRNITGTNLTYVTTNNTPTLRINK